MWGLMQRHFVVGGGTAELGSEDPRSAGLIRQQEQKAQWVGND